jgi:hypothetical protein
MFWDQMGLDAIELQDLMKEVRKRGGAILCMQVVKGEQGGAEYRVTVCGAPHEVIGLHDLLGHEVQSYVRAFGMDE